MNVPPAIVQPVAVALAFRLDSVPFERTKPVVAGIATVDVVAATEEVPKARLNVLADEPLPKTSVASPVTVNVSPDEAYVTKAVALNVPPAIVQLRAVALASRLVSVPFESTIPVVAGIATVDVVAATEEVPKTRLNVLADVPLPKTSVASPVMVYVSPDEAYVTKAVPLNVPPAIVQLVAVAWAFRL